MANQILLRIQSVPLLVFVPFLVFVALGAWAFSSPIGSSPDDDFHLTSIWCGPDSPNESCSVGTSSNSRTVPDILVKAPCFAYDSDQSAACLSSVGFSPEPNILTDRGNFAGAYPPVYYAVMHLFASNDFQLSVLLMRFFNILFFTLLLTATFMALPRNRRGVLAWSWLITSVPLGTFLIASNNPSSWAIIGVGTGWIAFLGFIESSSRRRAVLAGITVVATLAGAGARSDAALYSVIGLATVLVLSYRPRVTMSWHTFLLIGVCTVICAYFYFGSTQTLSALNGFGNPSDVTKLESGIENVSSESPSIFALLAFNTLNVPSLWQGVFGSWGLGWLDTYVPSVVYVGTCAVFVAVGFVGIGSLSKRKAFVLAGLILALWALPVYVLTKGGSHIGAEVQPRYILPLIILFAGVLILQVGERQVFLTSSQAYLIAATLSVANFIALHFNMRRYITGFDMMGLNLDSNIEWWWVGVVPPMAVLFLGGAAFTGATFIVASKVKLAGDTDSLFTEKRKIQT